MNVDACVVTIDPELKRAVVKKLQNCLSKRGVAICLSGMDGSGKTTLAGELVRLLTASHVPVRHLHIYQWYANLGITPLLLLYNRYVARKVLVLDRTIYDNLAVLAVRSGPSRVAARLLLTIVLVYYPKFDYCLYLFTSFMETLLRRPDTTRARFRMLGRAYGEIAARVHYRRLHSDAGLFAAALRTLAAPEFP